MDDRVIKFRVGVLMVAGLILAGILVLLVSDPRSWIGGYTIHIHFGDAPGVADGTPVRKSGILIGRVTRVRFAEQGGVIVDAAHRSEREDLSRRSAASDRLAVGRRRRHSIRAPREAAAERAGRRAARR